jgi:uncharacterized protein YndB with AHSA1/START domain
MTEKGEIVPESAVRFVRFFSTPSGLRSAGAATATSPASPDGGGGGGPVNRVWQFLTDAKKLPEWHGDGMIEPREGGAVSLMGGHIRGVVTAWRPEKLLGYTWNVFSPGETVSAWPISYLEFSLEAAEAGTRLILTHRPIPAPMQKQTMMGWHTMLDLIEAGVKGEFLKRADLFPKNATLYGVDMSKLKR